VEKSETQEPLRIVFRVTERTMDTRGQALLLPELEIETYWTSLPDDPRTIVNLYHDHATCEQFHSELKTDMDMERLPSGKFQTNELVLLLGMMAYNILRLIGQAGLEAGNAPIRKRAFRRRVRSVMQDLIYLECRVASHARRRVLSFERHCHWFKTWRQVYLRFAPG
ncbi:MAG: transposase, partial [Chloroflexi bacterium]|nr:transposase [Chloroflexota bacterium]